MHAAHHPLAVVGVQAPVPPGRRRAEGRAGISEATLDALVPHDPVGKQVPVPHGILGRLRHQPVALLALAQVELAALAVRDILQGHVEVGHAASLVLDGAHRRDDPERLFPMAKQPLLDRVARALARVEQPHGLLVRGAVAGVRSGLGGAPGQRLRGSAEQLGQRAVGPQPATVRQDQRPSQARRRRRCRRRDRAGWAEGAG